MTRSRLAGRLIIAGLLPNPLFDESWYLARYPDVRARGAKAHRHYRQFGVDEGRDPNRMFRTTWYLDAYPDVRASGLNPLDHYLLFGAREGRDPSAAFDTSWYLEMNPDVVMMGMNPLLHYLRIGIHEGRAPRPAAASGTTAGRASVDTTTPGPSARERPGQAGAASGRTVARPHDRDVPLRVAYLLTTRGGGGGAHSVVQEARGLRDLGAYARIVVPARHVAEFAALYPEATAGRHADLFAPVDLAAEDGVSEFIEQASGYDCVIATIYHSVQLLERVHAAHPAILPAYYIQDYEPWFYDEGSAERFEAQASYGCIPGMIQFAKTPWLADIVEQGHGTEVFTVSPSLDHAVYFPPQSPRTEAPVRIATMIRPASPRRGSVRTMRVLRAIARELGDGVEIRIFGAEDAELAGLVTDFEFENVGPLTREGVAETLRWASVFVDLSDWQAFGRTGLEAMACGCAVVLPRAGGADLFAEEDRNCLLVDTRDESACHEAVRRLATDPRLARELAAAGRKTAGRFTLERAAASVLALLENASHVWASRAEGTNAGTDHEAAATPLPALLGDGSAASSSGHRARSAPLEPHPHVTPVDIVVCVHDAHDDVERCLESIISATSTPYSLIIVDDGSEAETRDFLRSFAEANGATLLRNETAVGYTRAANQGMQASKAGYLTLLNSDTVVTPYWLDRLVDCAESDPSVGIVGPLSNHATWQSVPDVTDGRGQAANHLPTGYEPADMARVVARASARTYPEATFLNGFCLLIRRAVVEGIGRFDEERFGDGYGEENDYCLRARQAGWRLLIADDAYVYHRGARSYTPERKAELTPRASRALIEAHGRQTVRAGVEALRHDRRLEGIRARVGVAVERERLVADGAARWGGCRVTFLLPAARRIGGGANVVIQLAAAMGRMGMDVRLVDVSVNHSTFEPGDPALEVPIRYVASPADMSRLVASDDLVVATHHRSVDWLDDIVGGKRPPVCAYLIQDFEPWFFEPGTPERDLARASYTRLPGLVRVTTTEWLKDEVLASEGVDSHVMGALVDVDRFRPRTREAEEAVHRPLRVVAMVRPSTPRRGAQRTMRVLRALRQEYGRELEVIIFGCAPDDPGSSSLVQDFAFTNVGPISHDRVARLLNESDVFLDLSDWQAMGLTALEAMCCGVAVVVPEKGGASSIVRDGSNGCVVDTRSFGDCLAAARSLLNDDPSRASLAGQAIRDAVAFHPERAAHAFLAATMPDGVDGSRRRVDGQRAS